MARGRVTHRHPQAPERGLRRLLKGRILKPVQKHQRLKENAMATFQAPPWWPPPTTTFFLLMITGAAFSPGALILPPFNSPNGRYSRKEITNL